jgi:MOSC domain-containing protein YiiM
VSYHLSEPELQLGLPNIQESPQNFGRVEMIVIRPDVDARQALEACYFSPDLGAEGDTWRARYHAKGKSPDAEAQIAVMNFRSALLIAQTKERCIWAGDNLFVDFDLSVNNLQPGQHLSIGSALFEMTAKPHNGCHKFADRFGKDAVKFVNSSSGKQLHLRGIYFKVLQAGTVKVGDLIQKC